ncbi:50S ribosomal protein L25/general stress protein Ctc [Actinomyces radicidentis]|uniref:Large ribosomal subunit protein bL25 n=1 Tax=Actinomyces radicidentis TaxID=111015 RepID=A0A0X8JE15_ACTRD|nr:50S ribosomal protein L25/general stress protein Ctc [Actinomyces radicidentis]AMD86728.1 50S ribosomal protein L25/general stress protein Ctc [Actinomyces radicidentis]
MANKATTLKAQNRTDFGKGSARQARRDGQVPAVVYGHGTDPRHVLLDEHATRLALRSNENALIELDVEGESVLVLTKDVQRHPIRPGVQHVDFLLVNRNERVDVEVPVAVIGEPEPGTIHMIDSSHILVSARVVSIPETIEVDITGVAAGTVITVADLKLPEGVEAAVDAETGVVNVADEEVVTDEVPETVPAEGEGESEGEAEAAEEASEEE